MPRHRFCLAAGTAAVLLLADPAPAQVLVTGVLVDDRSGAPIPAARITLAGSRGAWRGETLTDSLGEFRFADVHPGAYGLRARRVGYRDTGGSLRLAADSAVELEVRMAPASVALDPVTVVARSARRVSPVLQGYYQRLARGHGRFVTRGEIETRKPARVTDLLGTLPNIASSPGRGGVGGARLSHGSSGNRCTMVFFIDAMLISQPAMAAGVRGGPSDQAIDDYVHPGDIEGIEIYRGPSDTPAEFVTRGVSCGTVVIWTRRGGPRGGEEDAP